MAQDLREVLSRYVPAAVLDEAVEEIKGTEVAPEWFRSEAAKLGADAKEAQQLRARLESIESAPKRKEALKRVGIDYDAVPKYGRKALDDIPADKLDDLEFVANYVQEQGFEASPATENETGEKSGAEQVTEFLTTAGTGAPVRPTSQAAEEAFYADLDRVPDGDKEAIRAVLAKHGRLAE